MEKFRNLTKFFLGLPLTTISFLFVFKIIFDNLGEVHLRIQNFNFFPLSVGMLFLVVFFLFRALVWHSLLKREGLKIPASASFYFLSISEIKRYIPGSIFGFIGRASKFGSFKIPVRKTMKLIFYESLIFVLSSAIVSLPGIVFLLGRTDEFLLFDFLPLLAIQVAILLLIVWLFRSWLAKIRRIMLGAQAFQVSFALMFVAWIFFGIGNLLVAASFEYLDPRKVIELVSLFVLSWLIGYIVLVAPLGLGVREVALAFSLSFFMPLSVAATVAILLRIALVVSEVIFLSASYLFYKFIRIKRSLDFYSLSLWVLIASYITYFSYVSFEKHANFFTGRFDLGNMDQTVWNTLHGRIFELTNPDGTNIISRLAIHADFILIFLAPFYVLWEDPRTLLLIQSIVLGGGAYFVYKISEKILNNNFISLAFSISYLLNPWVQKQNLFDFHAVTLATTLFLAAFYFSLAGKYKHTLAFLILAALTKENIYLISFIFGIYLFVRTKNRFWMLFSLASLGAFYLLVSKIMPAARGSMHFATEYFQEFGDSPAEIVRNIILNPAKTVSSMVSFSSFEYVYKLFLPVGFLSLIAPLYLIFVSPEVVVNLLSQNENLRSLTFHYAATIIPFAYISAIYGAKFLLSMRFSILRPRNLGLFLLTFSFLSTYYYGTLPGSQNPSIEIYEKYVNSRDKIADFMHGIPEELSVAATNNLGAHLSHRRLLYTIPYGIYEADVVLFLLNDSYARPSLEQQELWVRELRNNPNYIELVRMGDFVAFSKRESATYIRGSNVPIF